MNFDDNFGVPITDDIKNIIRKAIKDFGGQNILADHIGIPRASLSFILGTKKRQAKCISWVIWPKLRKHLEAAGLIDATDPQWMTPDELRRGGRETRYGISDGPNVEPDDLPMMPDTAVLAGKRADSSPKRCYWTGVPHSEPSSSDFLSRLMASEDIPADVKVVIFQEHERFLSDFGTNRHDTAQHGTLARFSTERNESNV